MLLLERLVLCVWLGGLVGLGAGAGSHGKHLYEISQYDYVSLPVFCNYGHIEGTWLFKHSEFTHLKQEASCHHTSPDDYSVMLKNQLDYEHLKYSTVYSIHLPAHGTNQELDWCVFNSAICYKARFTLVSNIGIHLSVEALQINILLHFKYLPLPEYEKNIYNTSMNHYQYEYQSDCSQTYLGFVSNSTDKSHGCVVGKKIIGLKPEDIHNSDGNIANNVVSLEKLKQLHESKHQYLMREIARLKALKMQEKADNAASLITIRKNKTRQWMKKKFNMKNLLLGFNSYSKDDCIQALLPNAFSWTDIEGIVDPVVEKENSCGMCYVFAMLNAMNARYRIVNDQARKSKFRFSPQHLLECSFLTQGCKSGDPFALAYYAAAYGMVEEECYNTTEKETCGEGCDLIYPQSYEYIGGYYSSDVSDLDLKTELMNHGPLVVAVSTIKPEIWSYQGGIYTSNLTNVFDARLHNHPDHAMTLVGWGEEGGAKYWLLKNSWSSKWGEQGFIKVSTADRHFNIKALPLSVKFTAGVANEQAPDFAECNGPSSQ